MSKAPEFLHVSFKEQRETDYSVDPPVTKVILPLGFANVYEPRVKAYTKRLKTQMDWAYGEYNRGYEVREDGVYILEHRGWIGTEIGMIPTARVPEHLQPKIIKNDPMEGFKISHSVSRYSTNNKLWRIEDPRGFELEITTGNMEDLLMAGTVQKGAFMGMMQWQTGKMLRWAA